MNSPLSIGGHYIGNNEPQVSITCLFRASADMPLGLRSCSAVQIRKQRDKCLSLHFYWLLAASRLLRILQNSVPHILPPSFPTSTPCNDCHCRVGFEFFFFGNCC